MRIGGAEDLSLVPPPLLSPTGYAFRALIPLHFHCEGGAAAGCPTVLFPDPVKGVITVDRSSLVDSLYELEYARVWENIGYLAIFVGVFQVLNVLATTYVRHIVR